MDELRRWLGGVLGDEDRETQWLDLLSQLEYVGCRKILKSVPYERVDAQTLQHIHEEAFHAYLLKNLVRRRGRGGASWSANPLSALGWKYFQTLDQQVSALDDEPSYPLVSWAIESRVLQLYPLYIELTDDPEIKRTLKTILAQEKRHGDQFDEQVLPHRAEAAEIERRCWEGLMSGLEALWPAVVSAPSQETVSSAPRPQ